MNIKLFQMCTITLILNACTSNKTCFTYGGGPFKIKEICIHPFEMDESLVTREQFEKKMGYKLKLDSCLARLPLDRITYGISDSSVKYYMPAVCINYYEANEYCKKLGKRVPTEEEWEFTSKKIDTAQQDFMGLIWQWTSTNEKILVHDKNKLLYDIGDKTSEIKYVKGGSKNEDKFLSKPFMKTKYNVHSRYEELGFRCAK